MQRLSQNRQPGRPVFPGDTFLPGTHLFRALGQGGTQQFRCFGMISSGIQSKLVDEWMSYVDLGDIEASWPSGTSWPSSSGDV